MSKKQKVNVGVPRSKAAGRAATGSLRSVAKKRPSPSYPSRADAQAIVNPPKHWSPGLSLMQCPVCKGEGCVTVRGGAEKAEQDALAAQSLRKIGMSYSEIASALGYKSKRTAMILLERAKRISAGPKASPKKKK